jgi:enoyl-CoA hydratase/carnithine racemase
MPAELTCHSQGQTLVLTISHPEQRNALGPAIYAAGVEALNVAESKADVRSVVITGHGAQFSAGGNLRRLQDNRALNACVQAQSIDGFHNWIESIRAFPKPVIAAVEGAAAGAGFSVALACDLIVSASNAVFVAAYSNIGLSPDGGASWHLARMLPRQLATQLLLLGEKIDAQRLLGFGLVNQVVEPGHALSAALALAERLNQRAPNASASIKELLSDARHNNLTQQLRLEREHFVANLHHRNGGIGIEAFLGKHAAQFVD